jgi:RNA polymerase sigma-70 factor (ECF subfamily)
MMRPLPQEEVIQMYHETIRPLYAYVSQRVGGDVSLAEDLVQETWMRALDDWAKKGIPREPLAWLRRVARNTLVNHFRRVRLQPIAMESLDIGNEFLSTNPDDAAAVGWAMARLRRSHSEILEAFYFEEKTVHEIAAGLSLSERAVEGRLRRSRVALKKKLDQIRRKPAASRRRNMEVKDAKPARTR